MSDHVQDPFEGADEQESKLNMDDFQDVYELASKGQRFVNYLIDAIILWVLMMVVMIPFSMAIVDPNDPTGVNMGALGMMYLAIFVVMLGYYAVMEKTLGRTIGKMASSTRVVREDGGPITWGQAIGRSAARLIPFEPFSVLFSDKGVGWHDQFPNTRVIKNR